MKKLNVLFLAAMLLFSFDSFSQSKIFDNVVDFEIRSTVEITNNKQIVGYGVFYKKDKMENSALFGLTILDENLKEIGNNEFEGSSNLILIKAVYESDKILLSFYDTEKKNGYAKFVKVYDLKGKEIGLVSFEHERVRKYANWEKVAASPKSVYADIDNIEGKGFITIYQGVAETGGVDVQMIGLDGKLKWEKYITAEKKDFTDLYLLGITNNTIIMFQTDRKENSKKDANIYLLGLSIENGQELFKTSLDIKGLTYEPMFVKKSNDGKLRIVSTIADESDKFDKAKPNGIGIAELDGVTGDIKIIKDFNFENDLGTVLKMKNENKSKEGYIKAHDVLIMPDGSMVIVGEFFRKTVRGAGLAMTLLGGMGTVSASSQASIGDMFLLRIDNNLKATSLEKIEKDRRNISMSNDFISIGSMARLLSLNHEFGYMYSDEGMDGKQNTILARGAFGNEKYGIIAIAVDENKGYTTKKFNLQKEKKVTYFISRGKPGYVMVTKYNSKEKTISLNLEKVN